jgi:ComF family protein
MLMQEFVEELYRAVSVLAATVEDALMPSRCAFCGVRAYADEQDICGGCRNDLPWIEYACERCGQPLAAPLPPATCCATCQEMPSALVRTVAPLRYEFPVDAGLKALKFKRKLYYGAAFGMLLAQAAERLPVDIDAVLPVPLHWRRKALRGFNQAAELSRPLVRKRSLPVLRGVVRCRRTRYQSGLTPRQRERNLRDAFIVKRPPTARHVLIVDDVITTGATTRQLARALHKSGVSRISALAVAHAVPVRQRQPG